MHKSLLLKIFHTKRNQLVSHTDFRVEDAHCRKWVIIYMYTRVIKLDRWLYNNEWDVRLVDFSISVTSCCHFNLNLQSLNFFFSSTDFSILLWREFSWYHVKCQLTSPNTNDNALYRPCHGQWIYVAGKISPRKILAGTLCLELTWGLGWLIYICTGLLPSCCVISCDL